VENGYVFMNIKPGKKKQVVAKLKMIKGVKEARILLGIFDAIAKVEGETYEDIEHIYFNKIDRFPELTSSRLHIVACPKTRK